MSTIPTEWWKRTGKKTAYTGELQGNAPHCVYAAIAGAVNHLEGAKIWTPAELANQHQPHPTDFSVADTALTRAQSVRKHHHVKGAATEPHSPDLIRRWLSQNAIVILSQELGDNTGQRFGRWHMFTLVAHGQDGFQVWDTNGLQGFLTDDEIVNGFTYPEDGWYFLPHGHEDTLILTRTT